MTSNIFFKTLFYSPPLWLQYALQWINAVILLPILYLSLSYGGIKGLFIFILAAIIIGQLKKTSYASTWLNKLDEDYEELFNSKTPQIRYGTYLFHIIFTGMLGYGPAVMIALSLIRIAFNQELPLELIPYIAGLAMAAGLSFGILTLGSRLIFARFEKA